MHGHEPDDHVCPFCRLAAGEETDRNRVADVVLDTEDVLAFVSPKWWPNNAGHVIVVPNVWHFHVHVFPRNEGDDIYLSD